MGVKNSRVIRIHDLLATEVKILFLDLRTALNFNSNKSRIRMEAGNFNS